MDYKLKKIPITIITGSLLLLLYSFIVRDYDPWGDAYEYVLTEVKVPLSTYTVDFILFESSYTHSLLVLFMLLALGIYLFLFQEDENIISGLKTKKEYLIGLVNSGKQKISQPDKVLNPINTGKQEKKINILPSVNVSVKLVSMVVLLLIIGLLLGKYWIDLSNSSAPLSFWEAFFMAYGKYVFLVGLVMGGLAIIQYAGKSNVKVQSEPENKAVNESRSTSVNVDNFSEINIPWYRKNWILLVMVLSIIVFATVGLFKNSDNSSRGDIGHSKSETVEMKYYVGSNVHNEEVQNLFKQFASEPEISEFSEFYLYDFKSLGLSFMVSKEDKIFGILMYAGKGNEYNTYPGKLPFGIDFNDNRRDVEEKLGKPSINSEGAKQFWSEWELGIRISYKYNDVTDMNNKIAYITVF